MPPLPDLPRLLSGKKIDRRMHRDAWPARTMTGFEAVETLKALG
jgi:hypothetical protein